MLLAYLIFAAGRRRRKYLAMRQSFMNRKRRFVRSLKHLWNGH